MHFFGRDWKPHPSHDMKSHNSLVCLSATPRLGTIYECKWCEGEYAVTVGGQGTDLDLFQILEKPCKGVDPTQNG